MKKLIFLLILMVVSRIVYAETIYLKSGKKYKGEIVEKTDKYIKVDIGIGLPITFFVDEIEKVDSETTLDNTAVGDNIYVDNKYDISISGPDGWHKTLGKEFIGEAAKTQLNLLVVFSKLPFGTREQNPNINLGVELLQPEKFPIKDAIEYLEYGQALGEETFPGYSVISPVTEVNINNIIGARIEYSINSGFGPKAQILQYCFVKDKYAFIITATAREDIFEGNKGIFKNSLESFRFIDK